MFTIKDILETNQMITQNNLDVRIDHYGNQFARLRSS